MKIDVIVVGQLEVNCYIVTDDNGPEAIIIDPGDEFERINEVIRSHSFVPKYIVFTHAHYDHVCAVGDLKAEYHPLIVMHEDETKTYRSTIDLCMSWGFDREDFPDPDMLVRDRDTVELGSLSFKVIHTPGHTVGGICLYGAGTLFSGDTLFSDSVGRTDLQGGSSAQLRDSLRKLISLRDDTIIRSGHGEEISLMKAKEINPFLKEL